MKRILHVVNVYFVIPYFIGHQLKYFSEKGDDIHVICSPSPLLKDYANKTGFKYLEVRIEKAITPFKDIIAVIKICRYIKQNKVDIVVGHTPKGALLSMTAAKVLNVPIRVYFRHGLVYETMKGLKKQLMINADRLTALFATTIVCVSKSLYNKSLDDNLNPKRKQILLGSGTCGGIDTINKFNPDIICEESIIKCRELFSINKEAFVIGFVGRLVRDKGIIELIDAFDLLRQKYRHRKLILFLIGDFESRDALPLTIKKRIETDPLIIKTGFIFSSIERYYTLINLLILPSYREGFGMSIIEASAMKKPVLTCKVTGCIDAIVENVTGRFVDHNPTSISEGISFFFDDDIAMKYGNSGRDFVCKNFDYRILLPYIEKIYENSC